ncbi:MAG TPA: hypothetical protein VJ577_05790 [Burkholderiaceae bacterium]|nr:hypothetical protein [Burkholderiaceae bacterium]
MMIPIFFAIPDNEALAALLSGTAHWDAPIPHRKKRGTATMTGSIDSGYRTPARADASIGR